MDFHYSFSTSKLLYIQSASIYTLHLFAVYDFESKIVLQTLGPQPL